MRTQLRVSETHVAWSKSCRKCFFCPRCMVIESVVRHRTWGRIADVLRQLEEVQRDCSFSGTMTALALKLSTHESELTLFTNSPDNSSGLLPGRKLGIVTESSPLNILFGHCIDLNASWTSLVTRHKVGKGLSQGRTADIKRIKERVGFIGPNVYFWDLNAIQPLLWTGKAECR